MAVMALETMGFSTSQPVSSHGWIEPGGSNGSNQIVRLIPSSFSREFHEATPSSLDGCFMENPHLKWMIQGYPHGLETSVDHIITIFGWLIPLIHQVVRSEKILILLLKVTHVQIKLPNKRCSKPVPLILPSQLVVFSYIMDYMDHASLESNIAAWWLGIPL